MRFSARLAVFTGFLLASACHETTGTLLTFAQAPDASTADSGANAAPSRPGPDTTWQIQLSGTLDFSFDVNMYELDLFSLDSATAKRLHDRGSIITCYVSVGSAEPYRTDYASFPVSALGNALVDYPEEHWLDERNATVRSLMAARLQLASANGCDAVELSNLQAHVQDSGFPLTPSDELDYARWLLGESHAHGLLAGVSPSDDLITSLAADADWGFTEGCLADAGCQAWQAFTAADQPVFLIEYGSAADSPALCAQAAQLGYSLVIKHRELDAFRVGCPAKK